jgi:hypothetical protein
MTVPLASWLDDSHRDQLKELVNIAMGDGAKALSSVTARYIQLSVPQVTQVATHDLIGHCKFAGAKEYCCCVQEYSALGQAGWFLILINAADLKTYAALVDRDCVDEADHENILVQLAGVIAPVILPRIAKELRVSLKLGQVQPYLGLSHLPPLGDGAGAVNLAFSYAAEAPLESEELVGKGPVEMGFDVIMRAPADLVKQLAEKFSSRLDAPFNMGRV